jgi:hypothetical protein
MQNIEKIKENEKTLNFYQAKIVNINQKIENMKIKDKHGIIQSLTK